MAYFALITYILCLSYLLIFSINQFILTLKYQKSKGMKAEEQVNNFATLPFVTIQLPIFNERYVVIRLLEAIDRITYPEDRIEVQILDDSNDETSDLVRRFIQGRQRSYTHIVRNKRQGFKAGALKHGLSFAQGELVALFDADFVPGQDFLLQTVPYFQDPATGMVQSRWQHLNRRYSILTELQAFGLDAHFTVEQQGRYSAGNFINFNGTAGVWRKEAIIDGGGWSEETLTEDLDLSYRAQLKGWKFHYLQNYECPSELPVTVENIKSQQFRWTKGTAETARKLLPRLLRSDLSPGQKISSFFHLTSSLVFVCIFVSSVLSVPLIYFKAVYPEMKNYFLFANIFVAGFMMIAYFYWVSLGSQERRLRNYLWKFPLFMSLSMSLGAQNTLATIEGIMGIKTPFRRTPKFNIISGKDRLVPNNYMKTRITGMTILELGMMAYFGGGIALGISRNDYGLVIFHLFLMLGYAIVSFQSIREALYAKA